MNQSTVYHIQMGNICSSAKNHIEMAQKENTGLLLHLFKLSTVWNNCVLNKHVCVISQPILNFWGIPLNMLCHGKPFLNIPLFLFYFIFLNNCFPSGCSSQQLRKDDWIREVYDCILEKLSRSLNDNIWSHTYKRTDRPRFIIFLIIILFITLCWILEYFLSGL